MTRPHLTLEKWLSTETDLKKIFLEQEILLRPNEINKRVKSGEKEIFYSINHPQIKPNENSAISPQHNQYNSTDISELFTNPLKFSVDNFICKTNNEHFEILKKRYRIFKYNYTNKKDKRINKQITLDQKTLKELERITEKYKLKSLQNCLDFLIDQHNFKLTEKDKVISKLQKSLIENNDSQLKQELKLKDEEINQLKTELGQQKHTIQENMRLSAKEFEDYLIQTAVSKTIELEKIKAFLGEISEEDQQTINETLAPEALSQIETQLRNECAEQKQFLTMKNQPNTNIALGFDQHNQYSNTVQNDGEFQSKP
ncbi:MULTISPECIES: hypothetical protein [Acinetobacter]|uniref:hypothetical protein n=1 Tax=Acinetobacter TaxID=469 RepID=UPI0002D0607F|nr:MULTISPECIES: hypothetical protein [Acinetobacter]ENU59080.1 hypothetical protein F981_03389 [Acinetobacter guillouiae CIP 63.46]EPH33782.1 hypothetical protein L291_2556 [Acinetobacter guillouiae MSP4-18]KAB0625255.1 hypothetical protein F7P82_16090 [Acinetobacter guillouiae]MRA47057.1 hypothetical protein [Acinetobacter pittii]RZG77517.1 hypothetical protein EXE09_03735 [Acinetobacter sp. WCHAc060025]